MNRRKRTGNKAHISNFKEVTLRGNALQIADKYRQLEKEALSVKDRTLAEGYAQQADHWQRIWDEENDKN
jgi:hypothetical protein